MKYIVSYSFRDYREIEVSLPASADADDEDEIREALERQHGLSFSEDEKFCVEGVCEA